MSRKRAGSQIAGESAKRLRPLSFWPIPPRAHVLGNDTSLTPQQQTVPCPMDDEFKEFDDWEDNDRMEAIEQELCVGVTEKEDSDMEDFALAAELEDMLVSKGVLPRIVPPVEAKIKPASPDVVVPLQKSFSSNTSRHTSVDAVSNGVESKEMREAHVEAMKLFETFREADERRMDKKSEVPTRVRVDEAERAYTKYCAASKAATERFKQEEASWGLNPSAIQLSFAAMDKARQAHASAVDEFRKAKGKKYSKEKLNGYLNRALRWRDRWLEAADAFLAAKGVIVEQEPKQEEEEISIHEQTLHLYDAWIDLCKIAEAADKYRVDPDLHRQVKDAYKAYLELSDTIETQWENDLNSWIAEGASADGVARPGLNELVNIHEKIHDALRRRREAEEADVHFRTLEQCCNTVHELRESYLDVYHAGSESSYPTPEPHSIVRYDFPSATQALQEIKSHKDAEEQAALETHLQVQAEKIQQLDEETSLAMQPADPSFLGFAYVLLQSQDTVNELTDMPLRLVPQPNQRPVDDKHVARLLKVFNDHGIQSNSVENCLHFGVRRNDIEIESLSASQAGTFVMGRFLSAERPLQILQGRHRLSALHERTRLLIRKVKELELVSHVTKEVNNEIAILKKMMMIPWVVCFHDVDQMDPKLIDSLVGNAVRIAKPDTADDILRRTVNLLSTVSRDSPDFKALWATAANNQRSSKLARIFKLYPNVVNTLIALNQAKFQLPTTDNICASFNTTFSLAQPFMEGARHYMSWLFSSDCPLPMKYRDPEVVNLFNEDQQVALSTELLQGIDPSAPMHPLAPLVIEIFDTVYANHLHAQARFLGIRHAPGMKEAHNRFKEEIMKAINTFWDGQESSDEHLRASFIQKLEWSLQMRNNFGFLPVLFTGFIPPCTTLFNDIILICIKYADGFSYLAFLVTPHNYQPAERIHVPRDILKFQCEDRTSTIYRWIRWHMNPYVTRTDRAIGVETMMTHKRDETTDYTLGDVARHHWHAIVSFLLCVHMPAFGIPQVEITAALAAPLPKLKADLVSKISAMADSWAAEAKLWISVPGASVPSTRIAPTLNEDTNEKLLEWLNENPTRARFYRGISTVPFNILNRTAQSSADGGNSSTHRREDFIEMYRHSIHHIKHLAPLLEEHPALQSAYNELATRLQAIPEVAVNDSILWTEINENGYTPVRYSNGLKDQIQLQLLRKMQKELLEKEIRKIYKAFSSPELAGIAAKNERNKECTRLAPSVKTLIDSFAQKLMYNVQDIQSVYNHAAFSPDDVDFGVLPDSKLPRDLPDDTVLILPSKITDAATQQEEIDFYSPFNSWLAAQHSS